MSSKAYKIGLVPLDAFGHVNACLGLATNLRQRGHKCLFIVNQNWKDLIVKYDFEYRIYIEEHKVQNESVWNDFMIEHEQHLKVSSFDKIRKFNIGAYSQAINDIKLFNENMKTILSEVKPDAIVVDSFVAVPAVMTAGVPWIDLCSCNPLLYLDDERLPPGESGYPINDNKLWNNFKKELIDVNNEEWNSFNRWIQSEGCPPLESRIKFTTSSPYMNFYLCPNELSYFNEAPPQDSTRFSIDALIRTENITEKFEMPQKLINGTGKVIYFSMGTLNCSDLKLMRRLLAILNKSNNRFIVSKGPLGDQLHLGENMWGQSSVPQLQVLPLVDLVITHGGNNTVTESLYFGKPMIVLPVFGDQYDNAQRITEKVLGLRLDPYLCTETELLGAIEKLANDSDLSEKCRQISQRIQKSKSREMAAKIIEELIIKT